MGPSEERLSRDPARAALGALADRRTSTVFLVGPPGSGKSFVFNRLESELGARQRADPAPVFLRPTNGTRDVALGRLLVPAETTQQALSAPANGAAEPRLLAIDDIDLLDASSMSLLAQSLDRRRFRLVATVRSREAPAVFRTLRAVGRSAIVHVEPWHDEELDRFVAESLGDRMHPLTVRRLLDFTGGNALCLTELVELGSYDGHLRREHDVWTWHGDLFVPPLTEARVSGELERVGEECRAVLTTAALVGQVPLEVLEELHGIAAVEAADTTGLLLLEATGGHLQARPRSAVQGRVLAQLVPTTRRRRLAAALLEALAEPALPTQRLELPAAHLAVDCSVAVPPGLAVSAAQEALRRHEPALAEAVLSSRCRSAAITNEPTCSRPPCWPRAGPSRPSSWSRARPRPTSRSSPRRGGGLDPAVQRSLLAQLTSLMRLGRPTAALALADDVDACRFEPVQRVHLLALVGSCRLFRGDLREGRRRGGAAARPRPGRGLVLRLPAGCARRGRAALLAAEAPAAERFWRRARPASRTRGAVRCSRSPSPTWGCPGDARPATGAGRGPCRDGAGASRAPRPGRAGPGRGPAAHRPAAQRARDGRRGGRPQPGRRTGPGRAPGPAPVRPHPALGLPRPAGGRDGRPRRLRPVPHVRRARRGRERS